MESLRDLTSQKGSHCGHLNIRSLFNKHDVLRQAVENCNNNLHVLGLSETWLTDQIPDNFINFNGYTRVRGDRNWGDPAIQGQVKKGGGVCLYLTENINWTCESYEILNRSNNNIEIQWIEIINDNCRNFIVANAYRPPDGNTGDFMEYLEDCLNFIDLSKFDLFLMGDFNIDYLDKKSEITKKLKVILKQYGLDQKTPN